MCEDVGVSDRHRPPGGISDTGVPLGGSTATLNPRELHLQLEQQLSGGPPPSRRRLFSGQCSLVGQTDRLTDRKWLLWAGLENESCVFRVIRQRSLAASEGHGTRRRGPVGHRPPRAPPGGAAAAHPAGRRSPPQDAARPVFSQRLSGLSSAPGETHFTSHDSTVI